MSSNNWSVFAPINLPLLEIVIDYSFVTNAVFMQSVSSAPEPWVITSLFSHFYNSFFFNGMGWVCLLWNSWLFSVMENCGSHDFGDCPGALLPIFFHQPFENYSLASLLNMGLFCELWHVWSMLWEARKSQSLLCSEIPTLTCDLWCGHNCGPTVSTKRGGSVPGHSSGPHSTWALGTYVLSKWWEDWPLDVQLPLEVFLFLWMLVLSPPGFSFWYSSQIVTISKRFFLFVCLFGYFVLFCFLFFALGACLC